MDFAAARLSYSPAAKNQYALGFRFISMVTVKLTPVPLWQDCSCSIPSFARSRAGRLALLLHVNPGVNWSLAWALLRGG